MEEKKALLFALRVATLIIGVALFKQIDFQNLSLEKPALGTVYLITLVFLVYVQIRDAKSRKK